MKGICWLMLSLIAAAANAVPASPFSRPYGETPHWTVRSGVTLALHQAAIPGEAGGVPRGLIRFVLPLGGSAIVRSLNFIAVEPSTIDGFRDFSELQHSPSDGKAGIKFWFGKADRIGNRLRQTIHMEKFANGAHPYLIAELNGSRPTEVRFEVYAEKDSAPMKMCILSATMGNYQRLRRLGLKDRIATIQDVLPEDPDTGFTQHAVFPLRDLPRNAGGVCVYADSDEADAGVLSARLPAGNGWRYEGPNFQQYWRQPEPVDPDLRVLVNARKTYWMSTNAIPGGKAFENFEMNAAFHAGQVFIFGVKSPAHGVAPRK